MDAGDPPADTSLAGLQARLHEAVGDRLEGDVKIRPTSGPVETKPGGTVVRGA
jgi:hypothetical protein